jgi:GT2 family glycosyltransferase
VGSRTQALSPLAATTDVKPSVDVIIVNFNAGPHLAASIGAVLGSSLPAHVTISDNGSTDDSLALVAARFGSDPRVTVRLNGNNLGFAAASNIAAEQSTASYLLFLNPDCIVGDSTLERMVGFMETNPRVGMCGCIVRDPDGSEQVATRRVIPDPWLGVARMLFLEKLWPKAVGKRRLNWTSDPLPEDAIEVEAISGALMLVRQQAIVDVGMLDAGYFLHCEDLDWFVRFREHGWPIYLVPGAEAVHHKGACSTSRPFAVLWHKHRGMQRFFRKFQYPEYPRIFSLLVIVGIWTHFAAISAATWVRLRFEQLKRLW